MTSKRRGRRKTNSIRHYLF